MRSVQRNFTFGTLALALAACVSQSLADKPHPEEEAAKVTTQTVTARPVPMSLTLTGTLAANRRSLVASDGTGRVTATMIERGSFVRAGDVLVRLDTRSASLSTAEAGANERSARANSERARRDCERAQSLIAQDVINQAEYDRMTADCRSSVAQVSAAAARQSMARKAVVDGTIRAPFSGIVDERSVTVGEYVKAGAAVATLIEIDPLRLELTVPESSVTHVREGQIVEFDVAAYPDQTFTGKIQYVSGAVRRQSRDLVVEAVVANPDHRLKAGMFAVARVTTGQMLVPVVPRTAIHDGGELPRVFVAREGRLEERLVQLGRRERDDIAILAGLKPGERLVTKLDPELRDGLKVQVQ